MRTFSLTGPGMKAVRQSVTRLQRRGYTTRVSQARGARRRRSSPRSTRRPRSGAGDGGDERGFSMALGRLGDPLDGDCVLVEAHDDDGQLRGVPQLRPVGPQRASRST